MNSYTKTLIPFYIVTIIGILIEFRNIWNIGLIVLMIVIITIIQKYEGQSEIEKIKNKVTVVSEDLDERMNLIIEKLNKIRTSMYESLYSIHNRIDKSVDEREIETRSLNREMAKRVNEIENKIENMKNSYSTILGTFEDRINALEEK